MLLLYAILPYFIFPPPLEAWEKHTPAYEVKDAKGNTLFTLRGYDYEWRFPVPLEKISPHFIDAILSVEDRRFYEHGGVDYWALLRSFALLSRYQRILSGGSTISMQCVRLLHPEPRSLSYKVKQVFLARAMELQTSKDSILEYYLNHLPFGGKIVGVESAARYYFNTSAKDLTPLQSSILAGIPQLPNYWRPDLYPERLAVRHRLVLNAMRENGVISDSQFSLYDQLRDSECALLDTSFFYQKLQYFYPFSAQHFVRLSLKQNGNRQGDVCTTLQPEIQTFLAQQLQTQIRQLTQVEDGAGVVIENRTGRIVALVGTQDYDEPTRGQVNAATAQRMAGSTLKPLIYGIALDEGYISTQTLLKDAPTVFADYRPKNYGGYYYGDVTTTLALSNSLNIPAVQLLQEIGLPIFLQTMTKFHVLSPQKSTAKKYGLALALGAIDVSLLDLTQMYAAFARGGWQRVSFLQDETDSTLETIWSDGTYVLLTQMLSAQKLPEAENLNVAWKTGTSNGHRDAWCVAYTPEYTVGIWLGNKSGKASQALVGVEAAAPVAGRMIKMISSPLQSSQNTKGTILQKVCRESGLRPTSLCKDVFETLGLADVPLRLCARCKRESHNLKCQILSPVDGVYLAETDSARINFKASLGEYSWFLNGRFIQTTPHAFMHEVGVGKHTVEIYSERLQKGSKITFSVEK